MKYCLKYCFLLLLCAPALFANAQEKVVIKTVKKFKPPVVHTTWDNNKNGSTISVEEAIKMVSLPIKVKDSAQNVYTIDNYRFLYRSGSVVENEQTGKKEIFYTVTSDKFAATPLSKIWINNLRDNLKSGEQLFFFDVLVRDNQGRLFSAPDLKITIQ